MNHIEGKLKTFFNRISSFERLGESGIYSNGYYRLYINYNKWDGMNGSIFWNIILKGNK